MATRALGGSSPREVDGGGPRREPRPFEIQDPRKKSSDSKPRMGARMAPRPAPHRLPAPLVAWFVQRTLPPFLGSEHVPPLPLGATRAARSIDPPPAPEQDLRASIQPVLAFLAVHDAHHLHGATLPDELDPPVAHAEPVDRRALGIGAQADDVGLRIGFKEVLSKEA